MAPHDPLKLTLEKRSNGWRYRKVFRNRVFLTDVFDKPSKAKHAWAMAAFHLWRKSVIAFDAEKQRLIKEFKLPLKSEKKPVPVVEGKKKTPNFVPWRDDPEHLNNNDAIILITGENPARVYMRSAKQLNNELSAVFAEIRLECPTLANYEECLRVHRETCGACHTLEDKRYAIKVAKQILEWAKAAPKTVNTTGELAAASAKFFRAKIEKAVTLAELKEIRANIEAEIYPDLTELPQDIF